MNVNLLRQIPKRVAILTSVLGIGACLTFPVLADSHKGSMESPTEMREMPAGISSAGNIVEVASGNESFSILAKAIEAAGLVKALSNSSSSYTVFAPTDEAFRQLPNGALQYLLQPENQKILQRVLTYHVLPKKVTSREIYTGKVETLDGGLAIRVTEYDVIVNNASVIIPDIQASNGVIHAVNRVLLSEDLQSILASELGVESVYQ